MNSSSYVLASSGRRYVVVGIVNHANSGEARPALEALVRWVAGAAKAPRASSVPAQYLYDTPAE